MLDILSQLVNTIGALVTFVLHAITSFIAFIAYIPSYLMFITQSIALMPSILIPYATACISVYVILFMIGRNT